MIELPPLQASLFWIVATLTGLCALSVVITQNIVRAAVWLLFTLAGVSALFFLMGAEFVAATQLIVYVGGTLVLVVFGVMLTAQGPFVTMKASPAEWAISTLVGLLFLGTLVAVILTSTQSGQLSQTKPAPGNPASAATTLEIGESLLGIDKAMPEANLTLPRGVPGERPRTQLSYLLPFEIVSVHLLVVLIGAAYLARAKRRKGAETL